MLSRASRHRSGREMQIHWNGRETVPEPEPDCQLTPRASCPTDDGPANLAWRSISRTH